MSEHVGAVVGLDVGQTKIAAGLIHSDGSIAERSVHATPLGSPEECVEEIARLVTSLGGGRGSAIGVCIAAVVNCRTGVLEFGSALPLDGFPLAAWLEERFEAPVVVENDANAAALAEHRFGAGKGAVNMVLLTVGTGIGGGLVLDGALYRGSNGFAGELGHVTIDRSGPPCLSGCPGTGHLEALASGTAADLLAREVARREPSSLLGRAAERGQVDARVALDLALQGDDASASVFREIGSRLGLGVSGYLNIFDPDVVVIGGGLSEAGDLLLDEVRTTVAREVGAWQASRVEIRPAALGVDAGLIGAGCAAIDFVQSSGVGAPVPEAGSLLDDERPADLDPTRR